MTINMAWIYKYILTSIISLVATQQESPEESGDYFFSDIDEGWKEFFLTW